MRNSFTLVKLATLAVLTCFFLSTAKADEIDWGTLQTRISKLERSRNDHEARLSALEAKINASPTAKTTAGPVCSCQNCTCNAAKNCGDPSCPAVALTSPPTLPPTVVVAAGPTCTGPNCQAGGLMLSGPTCTGPGCQVQTAGYLPAGAGYYAAPSYGEGGFTGGSCGSAGGRGVGPVRRVIRAVLGGGCCR